LAIGTLNEGRIGIGAQVGNVHLYWFEISVAVPCRLQCSVMQNSVSVCTEI